jgi:hypothetical protein
MTPLETPPTGCTPGVDAAAETRGETAPDAASASPCVLIHGRCCTPPAPAVKIIVSASVTAQLGDCGSSVIGTRKMRRTRSSSDPPVAVIAIVVERVRQVSSSASA